RKTMTDSEETLNTSRSPCRRATRPATCVREVATPVFSTPTGRHAVKSRRAYFQAYLAPAGLAGGVLLSGKSATFLPALTSNSRIPSNLTYQAGIEMAGRGSLIGRSSWGSPGGT